jgi:hypothetical protein
MAEAKVEKETNVAGPLSAFSLMAYQALWLAAVLHFVNFI